MHTSVATTIAIACMLLSGGTAPAQTGNSVVMETGFNGSIPYILDSYQGKQELVAVHHETVSLDRHTGRNIAGSMAGSFFYHPKMTTELQGAHAQLQVHSLQPVLYVHTENDPQGEDNGDAMTPEILPAKIDHDKRTVNQMSFNNLTTRGKHTDAAVPVSITPVGQGWLRITPVSPLKSGEYVFLMQPANGSEFAAVVYPFGVDPDGPAPANPIPLENAPIPGLTH